MEVRNIRIDDFDYPLPEERIALHPLEKRDACKLLVANSSGKLTHTVFSELPVFLSRDTLIVANETKVIRARLEFVKATGARIEIFLLEPLKPHDYAPNFASTSGCSWICLIGNRKRWKEGLLCLKLKDKGREVNLYAEAGAEAGGNGVEVKFSWDNDAYSFAEIIEAAGNIPIPPYLRRESEDSDTTDYQTVYSKTQGSVAAPTAGLHFTPGLIEELRRRGNEFCTVTLHVGAGTFQPVKSEEIGDHPMHSEWIAVSRQTLRRLIDALENGRDILAVGTTSVRTLESLPYLGRLIEEDKSATLQVTQWMPYEEKYSRIDTLRALRTLKKYLVENGLPAIEAYTSIMIAPGFRWRIVNRLITNFHQPKSTLLLLVSSFLGKDNGWRKVYEEALAEGYRFLSYGDACLFSRGRQPVELPASKSMVIRAATILAAENPERLKELMQSGLCDDSEYYIDALRKVLASVELPDGETEEIYIGEGAAPLRFLIAFAASLPGAKVLVSGASGLLKRPISPLISSLNELGAEISLVQQGGNDSTAFRISGHKLKGSKVEVETSVTSQYVSALMLASLLWDSPLQIQMHGSGVSRPYIRMTEAMISSSDPCALIEPDWSAAACFFEYSFITGKRIEIADLVPPSRSLQGDSVVSDIFAEAETLKDTKEEFEFDFTDCPDLVPAVAVALCARRVPFRFHGVANLKYKECDRLLALQTLLVKLGYGVGMVKDDLVFDGEFLPMADFPVEIDPYGDHRIAMAFYPLELIGMVEVLDKEVAGKSFPDFYQQFK